MTVNAGSCYHSKHSFNKHVNSVFFLVYRVQTSERSYSYCHCEQREAIQQIVIPADAGIQSPTATCVFMINKFASQTGSRNPAG